ncbi:hypothetical protein TNCV_77661 [Trichonephila clavipes]|nr:hypothetical protein TNCV_77661 [Trichonephila clavipes]
MPTVPILVRATIGAGVHVQMFLLSGQSDAKPQCLVPKQAWCSFIDPLKGRKAESTLPSWDLSPGLVARKRDTLPLSNWASKPHLSGLI